MADENPIEDRNVERTSPSLGGSQNFTGMVPDQLKRESVRGGAATIMSRGSGIVLQIGTTLILARILSPTDYGLQAMVLTLINLCSLFQDAGLSTATVQRQNLAEDQISTIFWINVGLGSFLTILVAAAGPLLASFYKDPRLYGLPWLPPRCSLSTASIFSTDRC